MLEALDAAGYAHGRNLVYEPRTAEGKYDRCRIARTASGRVKQDLWERARTFALLNMAMADAYIAGWDSKYHYNFWRPATAIRLAAQDGNPAAPDASFETLLPTPPVPDMPSTHSALGMAAAAVLAHAFVMTFPSASRRRARCTRIRSAAS